MLLVFISLKILSITFDFNFSRVEDLKNLLNKLFEDYKETVESTMSSEENAKRMEQFFIESRNQETMLNMEIAKRSQHLFKVQQEANDLRTAQKNLEAEVNGCEATLKNLENRINRLDHDSLKQAEVIYEQDFKIQTLERRLNRLHGEKSNDELLALEKRIAELKKTKEDKIIQHDTLLNQYKRVEDETRKTKREIEDLNKQRGNIDTKLAELTLHIDTAQKLLEKSISQKQDIMVNENLKKLELNKLRDLLDKRADDVLNLNKERIKLESGMKERFAEIEIHQELLKTQLRSWNDELQTVSCELKDRMAKVEKLKKRYDIAMISMAPPESAAPEENSQAYYVIKAAQEKEELQREGDELDAKIKKAEKELRALENTLVVVNSNNQSYKQTYGKADGQSKIN
jgi:chromosome segregation ATPase